MKRFAAFLLAALIFVPGVHASMRARYVYCRNVHDTISASCSGKSYNQNWWNNVLPGIWDGWSDETGFDHIDRNADDALGSFGDASYVSGAYWLDSLYEEVHGDNSNGAFVEGWMSSSDLLDTSYEVSYDGYFVLAAGGIKIDQAGTYEFTIDGDDALALFMDTNEDGVLAMEPNNFEGINISHFDDPVWRFEKEKPFTKSVTFNTTGYKKIVFFKWDWGQISDGIVEWKKPGDTEFSVIPAAAFGEKKNIGLPIASIVGVSIQGQGEIAKSSWGYIGIDKCVPITLTAEAENMTEFDGTQLEGEYIWSFNDGRTVTTPVNTVTYCYNKDPGSQLFFNPKVTVKRAGKTLSNASKQVILFGVTETGDEPDCGVECEIPASVHGNTRALMNAAGIKVFGTTVIVPSEHGGEISAFAYNVSGRRSSLTFNEVKRGFDLKASGLSAGYYVVDILVDGKKVGATSMVLRN